MCGQLLFPQVHHVQAVKLWDRIEQVVGILARFRPQFNKNFGVLSVQEVVVDRYAS